MKFLLLLLLTSLAHADIMNLNEYMPTRLQDATPIDVDSMDIQMSADFNNNKGADEMVYRPNLRLGVTERLQLELLSTLYSGSDESESGELCLGGLYQFNESDDMIPVFAYNPMIFFPTGKGMSGIDMGHEFILTSTLRGTSKMPKTQFHINATWSHNTQNQTTQRSNSGLYIFGMSQLLGESTALVVDVLHEEEDQKHKESNAFEVGIHQGLGNEFYISVGGGVGFGGDSQNYNGLFALEKQVDGVL